MYVLMCEEERRGEERRGEERAGEDVCLSVGGWDLVGRNESMKRTLEWERCE